MISLLILFFAQDCSAKSSPLWREWYEFISNGKTVGYFVEEVEKRTDQKEFALTQRWQEQDEGGTETYIGSVSKLDTKLEPIAFFSEKKAPIKELTIEGKNFNNSLEVSVKYIVPISKITKSSIKLPAKSFLSSFLSIYISQEKKLETPVEFLAIVEDPADSIFTPRPGKFTRTKKTKKMGKENCRLAKIEFDGLKSEWWIADSGKLCELEISSTASKIVLSTEEKAKEHYSKNQ